MGQGSVEITGIRRVTIEVRRREGQGKGGKLISGESEQDGVMAQTFQRTKGM